MSPDRKLQLAMKNPTNLRVNDRLRVAGRDLHLHFIDTGSPHVVLFLDTLDTELRTEISEKGVGRIGSLIRYHEQFAPDGVNVNLVEIGGPRSISVRTYERGVETETLSCGTG